jgi:hypothetical protein
MDVKRLLHKNSDCFKVLDILLYCSAVLTVGEGNVGLCCVIDWQGKVSVRCGFVCKYL